MTSATLLFRQVHETWIHQGVASSQTFRPTPKDNEELSVYDGDVIGCAEQSYIHWTSVPGHSSAGVLAVAESECVGLNLSAVTDGVGYPAHAIIDFTHLKGHRTYAVGELGVTCLGCSE